MTSLPHAPQQQSAASDRAAAPALGATPARAGAAARAASKGRAHRRDGGEGATRRCIVSRQPRPRSGLIRFVLAPNGEIVPDLEEKLPGRGFWLAADKTIVEKACKTNAFSKVAKAPVILADDLLERLQSLTLARTQRWLGQARGAGQLQIGFFQVREALAQGRVGVLIEASDGAANGKAKLANAARGLEITMVDWIDAEALGAAVGRDHLVHLALAPGRIADLFYKEALRFAGLTGIRPQRAGGEQ